MPTHIHVSTPLGQSLVVNQVYRSYFVSFVGYDNWVYMVILGMLDFDTIISLDFIDLHHVILDCNANTVTLAITSFSSF